MASRQAKRRIEPFRVIWLRPHMNKLGNCLTMVHSIDGMHPTVRSALLGKPDGKVSVFPAHNLREN